MRNKIFTRESLAEMEAIDALDVYGDGSNLLIRPNDICVVIEDGVGGFVYKVVSSLDPLSDDLRQVLNGGGLKWKIAMKATNPPTNVPPGTLFDVSYGGLGTIPDDFVPVQWANYFEPWAPSPTVGYQYPFMTVYGGFLYFFHNNHNGNEVKKMDLATSVVTTVGTFPTWTFTTGTCALARHLDSVYFFDTQLLRTGRFDLNTETFTEATGMTAPPGSARTQSGACSDGTWIYLFNHNGENYAWNPTTDTWSPALAANVQAASLLPLYDSGRQAVYCLIQGDTFNYVHKYDIALDSWSTLTITPTIFEAMIAGNANRFVHEKYGLLCWADDEVLTFDPYMEKWVDMGFTDINNTSNFQGFCYWDDGAGKFGYFLHHQTTLLNFFPSERGAKLMKK